MLITPRHCVLSGGSWEHCEEATALFFASESKNTHGEDCEYCEIAMMLVESGGSQTKAKLHFQGKGTKIPLF